MDLRLAEAHRERPVLIGREVLVGEEQHQVLVQQLTDEGELGVGDGGQRQPPHLGAQRPRDPANIQINSFDYSHGRSLLSGLPVQ